MDSDNLLRSLDALTALPRKAGLVWLADRRPSDHLAGSEPMDIVMWIDAATGDFREGGMVLRSEARIAWPGSFLEAANGWTLQAAPVLPEEVRVADPLGVEVITEALADLGVRVVALEDASALDPVFAAMDRGLEGLPKEHDPARSELSEMRDRDTMRFALEFASLKPWETVPSPPFFAVQGLLNDPVWLAVIGKAGIGVGLVACLDGEGPGWFRPADPKSVHRCATLQFHLIQGPEGVEPFVGRTSPAGAYAGTDADIALFLRIGEVFLRFMQDFDGRPATRQYLLDNLDAPVTVRWPVHLEDIPPVPGPMNRAARRRMKRQRG